VNVKKVHTKQKRLKETLPLSRHAPPSHKMMTNVVPFELLKRSTKTCVVFSNIILDLDMLFHKLPFTEVEASYTKKQKNIDKKKLRAPYGAIISLARLVKEADGTSVRKVRGLDLKSKKPADHGAKLPHFRNDITIILSLEAPILDIMCFGKKKKTCSKFKIVGFRDEAQAMEGMGLLWREYIFPMKTAWYSVNKLSKAHFLFRTDMENVGFNIGFPVDRDRLNKLMNDPEHGSVVRRSTYESTGNTMVNIKMFIQKPSDLMYDVLVLPFRGKPRLERWAENPYNDKRVDLSTKSQTCMCFGSGSAILSGRFPTDMARVYGFLIETILSNREYLEDF
jgi:hypothetical protein